MTSKYELYVCVCAEARVVIEHETEEEDELNIKLAK